MKVTRKLKILGLFLYAMSILGALIIQVDNIPSNVSISIYRFRYVFLIFLGVYFISNCLIFHKRTLGIILGLLVFNFFWGCVVTNNLVAESSHAHMLNMLWYFLFIFGTAHFISDNQMIKEFLSITFLVYFILIIWCYFTHFSGFSILRYFFFIASNIFHVEMLRVCLRHEFV